MIADDFANVKDQTHLTTKEAAHRLGISYPICLRQIRAGNIPAIKPGRDYRIPISYFESPYFYHRERILNEMDDVEKGLEKTVRFYALQMKKAAAKIKESRANMKEASSALIKLRARITRLRKAADGLQGKRGGQS